MLTEVICFVLMNLRQDQCVLESVVLVQAGLMGINLIMQDGQLTQALHKGIGFRGITCKGGKNTYLYIICTAFLFEDLSSSQNTTRSVLY